MGQQQLLLLVLSVIIVGIAVVIGISQSGQSPDVVAYNAPCAILVHTTKDDLCGAEDSVYAASNIQYAAETLGLGTCCIGFITGPVNADKNLKKLVQLPPDHKVRTSLVVGYPQFKYTKSVPKSAARAHYIE